MATNARSLSRDRIAIRVSSPAIGVALAALALAGSVALYDVTGRVLPDVRVAGVAVSGLTPHEAHRAVAHAAAGLAAQPVIVVVGEREWRTTNGDLGITVDVERAIAQAQRLTWFDVARGERDVPLARHADPARLAAFLAQVAREVERPAIDGRIELARSGPRVTEPAEGLWLDRAELARQIQQPGDLGAREVRIAPVVVPPAIDHDAMAGAVAAATASYRPLSVDIAGRRLTLASDELLPLVRLARDRVMGEDVLVARVDPRALDTLVAKLAESLDRAPRDARMRAAGERLEVVPADEGAALDRAALAAQIEGALFADGDRTVAGALRSVPAAFTTEQAQKVAADARVVGSFTTPFTAGQVRNTNIRIGASRLDGLVLRPGESFSFWERLGEVSQEAGYVEAGAILNGRSDKALGGGLCQVSTTLFNAVARAGLKIDERHPHSYYIERYPLGLDAAVLHPDADLRFTNDTAHPVYVFSATSATTTTFTVYSVPTRRVTFAAPVQRNLTDPAPDQPADPAHPAGYVVQGRDAWVTRTVVEDGRVVHRDTFYSHYAPVWGGPAAGPR